MKTQHSLSALKKEIRKQANPAKAKFLQRFFRTGKGEYAEGDRFLGITVPVSRSLARKYSDLALTDILRLLRSPFHEERIIALFLLVARFEKGNDTVRTGIVRSYLASTHYVNNWDLVDSSAYQIIGAYLVDKKRTPLYRLARSKLLWERRIAMVATLAFIRRNDLDDTFKIAEILLADRHDLIHKAVGWMLREAGKKDPAALRAFLLRHASHMPRTALRYAIEKYSPRERRLFLNQ